MLTKENIKFIDPSLKYSIKEYLPYSQKILLYDILVFLSITSETKMFCSSSDLTAFKTILTYCQKLEISPEAYFSIAYSYVQKYVVKGHRLTVGYFLNEKVIEYVANHLEDAIPDSLILEDIKTDILLTEKEIRGYLSEDVSYEKAFGIQLRNKKISDNFIAYKKFCTSSFLSEISSDYLTNLVAILEPFFTYILAKNHIYTPYKIREWNNSKLEDFSFCPLYFKDRYITNELPETILGNDATRQGTRLHKIFEVILDKYKEAKKKDLKNIAERFFKTKQYEELIQDLDEHKPYIEQMFLCKESSILHELINEKTEILTEYGMSSELVPGTTFYGTADLILVNGTKAYILDYKSSKLDPRFLDKNNQKYHKQLSLYALLFMSSRPEITSMSAAIIYTRGLTHKYEDINTMIHEERGREIELIKKKLKSGVLEPNERSCFLCRHPNCAWRVRQSIWNTDGSKKIKT